jgi:uncharacterized protein (TIRG00374 family)
MRKLNSIALILITIAIITLIIIIFLVFIDIDEVIQIIKRSDLRYLFTASLAFIGGLILFAVRWQYLLAGKPKFLSTFYASCVGHMLNILFPIRVGDVGRIIMLGKKESIPISEVTSSFFIERLLEQLFRLITLGIAVYVGIGLTISPYSLAFGLALTGTIIFGLSWLVNHPERALKIFPQLISKIPKVTEKKAYEIVDGLLDGLSSVSSTRRMIQAIGLTLAVWTSFWLFNYLSLLALNIDLDSQQMLILSLGALGLAPPSAPTSPGIFHASVVVPLSVSGVAEEVLTSYAIIMHASHMVWMLGFGIIGVIWGGLSIRELLSSVSKDPKVPAEAE